MKKRIVIFLSIILILVIYIVFIEGISVVTPLSVFSTKYFKNAEDAFMDSYSPSSIDISQGYVISELEELDVVLINEYNALFIGKDKEHDTIIVSSMHVKNGKYLQTTSYFVYRDIDIYNFSEEVLQSVDLYGSKGKFTNKGYFALCRNCVDNEKYYSVKINSSLDIYLVIQK